MKERLVILVYALFVLAFVVECCTPGAAEAQARQQRPRTQRCDTSCRTDSGGRTYCKTTCR